MATRLVTVLIATADPLGLAGFWSALLGWPITVGSDGPELHAPEGLDMMFEPVEPVDSARTGQNRIHLDLASSSVDDQRAIVERARDLGARLLDIGQGDVPWVVLADPDGNEFCVLEPRDEYRATGAVAAVVIAAANPLTLAEFWATATDRKVTKKISVPHGDFVGVPPADGRGPWLEFLPESGPKSEQNRIHLDVAPYSTDDQAAEVERLRKLGARSIDIGQGDVSWEVMADPEGNEYCVLTSR